jgi:hypothetical protein
MSDHADSAAVASTFSSVQVVLVSVLAASVGVVLATPALGGYGPAVATVAVVFAEAIALYVGYGVLVRVAGPVAREILVSD